ncbi:MAG: TrkA C-terminal domain-containing protein [Calditrichia bacterium]
MIAFISLLIILSLSITVTRIATVALVHTGLSKEMARFQARSAFTGCGFTTTEAEQVVNHPVRRKIILILMLLGNIGIVSAMSSLVLTFVAREDITSLNLRLLLVIGGVILISLAARNKWLDQHISALIDRILKRYTNLEVRDYSSLLHLARGYRVSELQVEADDWLANKKLMELQLRDEGVLVLGVQRKKSEYIGAPTGSTLIQPDDTLILYGPVEGIEALDQRKKGARGDKEHKRAMKEQKRIRKEEEKKQEILNAAQNEQTAEAESDSSKSKK